tara:strand:- start:572 stop:991 length:420 start_codon:yes stop_codon:yes gene_type:complete
MHLLNRQIHIPRPALKRQDKQTRQKHSPQIEFLLCGIGSHEFDCFDILPQCILMVLIGSCVALYWRETHTFERADHFRRAVQSAECDDGMADREVEMAGFQQPLSRASGIESWEDVVAGADAEELEVLMFFDTGERGVG